MAKVSKRLISEFVNEKGLEFFDFDGLMSSISEKDLVSIISDSNESVNPGFNIYSQRNRDDTLAVNVKTHFGGEENFNALPPFIKEVIPENDFNEYLDNKYNDNDTYQMEYEDWKEQSNLKCVFGVAGESGGYWTISDISSSDAFKPVENNKILEGLKKHLATVEEGNNYDSKEEMFENFETSIYDLCNVSSWDQEGHLDYVKNSLGLIEFDSKFISQLNELYTSAKSKVEYYEYKPNMVLEVIDELDTLTSEEKTNLRIKYEDYCFEQEIKSMGIELNKESMFNFKTGPYSIDFIINTEYKGKGNVLAKVQVFVDGEPFSYEKNHNKIIINGNQLDYYLDNYPLHKDTFDMIKNILDFKSLVELNQTNKVIERENLLSIIGTVRPEKINKSLLLEKKITLDNNNRFVLKINMFLVDNKSESKIKLKVKDGKFDLNPVLNEIKEITQYNYRVEEFNKVKNDPEYDFYSMENMSKRNNISEIDKAIKPFELLSNLNPELKIKKPIDIDSQNFRENWFTSTIKQNRLSCLIVPNDFQNNVSKVERPQVKKQLDISQ